MKQNIDRIRDHYQAAIPDQDAMIAKLASLLDGMEGHVTAERLGAFDQFHVGGLVSTAELAKQVGLSAGLRVLDAGSGLGGPSRYLAETFGCHVMGVDLAPAYVRIAELLAARAGLSDKVRYQVGSITELPFEDSSFDLVWTQHVVMNIADRDGLYREIRRVLTPGGRFAFYDPYAPDVRQPLHYPVPWAETDETTTLLTEAETVATLRRARLHKLAWDDVSELAKGWIVGQKRQLQQPAQAGATTGPKLSPELVVGARMQSMVANFGRNIMEDRVRLVMGICEAA
jgi:SAM-dependent methyltransferase